MSKKIFIIILNWNKGDLTIDCLESLYKMSYRDFEVILVDNGSVDDSVDRISAKYPALKIIKNSENLGFLERRITVSIAVRAITCFCLIQM